MFDCCTVFDCSNIFDYGADMNSFGSRKKQATSLRWKKKATKIVGEKKAKKSD